MNEKTEEAIAVAEPKRSFFDLKAVWMRFAGGLAENDNTKIALLPVPSRLKPLTICTINQKGGCGKTTTVVNLSAALAEKGYRVLVIDMDPQAHASLGLGITLEPCQRSVYDLMVDPQIAFGDVMRKSCVPGLDVLPASGTLASAQIELANMARGESILKLRLKEDQNHYDFIFIDCPPTLNLLTLNALTYAKRVLIPVQTHYYALEGMKELFKTIEAIQARFNPELEILGILATLFDKRMRIAGEMLEALRSHFQDKILQTVIHNNVKLIEAPMLQQPVLHYAPKSVAAAEYQQLATEIVHLVVEQN